METTFSRSVIFTAGLAIFAMQFGAGNIVFALSAGHFAQDKTLFAILGLIITGVVVPLVGLIAMTLFNGDYKSFFGRVGKVPGFILTALMLSLLGPFGATPRCIALSYSTSKAYLPAISLPIFSLICCLFIFLFTVRRTKILDVIGRFLTPLKLGSLTFLIIWGIIQANTMPSVSLDGFTAFSKGFTDGYQTMDLLGAFFICSVILDCLKKKASNDDSSLYKSLIKATLKASCIGSALLALIYVGFSYTAAYHSHGLDQVSPDELVGRISMSVLGAYGGIFVCFAVTIACLTTAIALSTIFAEFLHKDVSLGKVSYPVALAITLAVTFVVSTLDFTGIIKMLTPVLHICYPALIVLSVLNILHKLLNFQPVKIPVLVTFCISLLGYLLV